MSKIPLPWGDGEIDISLPNHWTLGQIAESSLRPAPKDWPDRLAAALNQTSTGPSLAKMLAARPGGRIVLVVEDITRHSPLPQILEIVLREIRHAGVTDEQLGIVFATGMHTPMTEEQVAEKLGNAAEGIKWRCNPWHDPSQFISIGRVNRIEIQMDRAVVEADLRIVISAVSPHLQAGFGGGYKMFFPGCASKETIRGIHRLGITRGFRQLVGTDISVNLMRTVIDAAGKLLDSQSGTTFGVQYVLDESSLPTFIATGKLSATQQMLSKQCSLSCGVIPDRPADVLITNSHPLDFDLWQSFKCIPNTLWAARPGGVIICTTACRAGLAGMKIPATNIKPEWVQRIVRWLGPDTISSLLMRLVPSLAGDAAFFVRLGLKAVHRNTIFMVNPTLHAENVKFPGMRIFGDVAEAIEAADKLLGGKPQNVVIYPAGGATYPIPPRNIAREETL